MITATANIEPISISENIRFYDVLKADATEWKGKLLSYIMVPDTVDKASVEANLQKTFQTLANQWRKETSGSSSPLEKIANENYLMIIKKGGEHKEAIVPLILKELEKKPNYWFEALKIITGKNPVKPEEFTSYKLVTKAWLNWGIEEGYL